MRRTPTGWITIAISWLVFFGSLLLGSYYLVGNAVEKGVIILITGLALSVIFRILANINEFLFNIDNKNSLMSYQIKQFLDNYKGFFEDNLRLLSESIIAEFRQNSNDFIEKFDNIRRSIQRNAKDLEEGVDNVNQTLQQNSKDMAGEISNLIERFQQNSVDITERIDNVCRSLQRNSKDIYEKIENVDQALQQNLKDIAKESNSTKQLLIQNSKEITKGIDNMEHTLQQVNCDSKDINQNLYKLTSFLGEIEKHLDLKK